MPLTHMVFLQLCDQPAMRRGPPMLTYCAQDPRSVPHDLRYYAPRALEPSPPSYRSEHMSPSSDTMSDSGSPSLTSAHHLLTGDSPSQQLSPLGSRASSSESQRKATTHRPPFDHPDSHGGTLLFPPLPPSIPLPIPTGIAAMPLLLRVSLPANYLLSAPSPSPPLKP
jgi:hypothetical protein